MTAARASSSASTTGPTTAPTAAQLAVARIAVAVTDGPSHVLRYANAAFRHLQSSGDIAIGSGAPAGAGSNINLTSLLDRAFRGAESVRDEFDTADETATTRWSCTVWPMSRPGDAPTALVVEIRDAAHLEGALAQQRAITERLLLSAMREQDAVVRERLAARAAMEAGNRASFLAIASRDLAGSIAEGTTRDTVTRRTLPREGTWCIVDIVESGGATQRLAIVHPEPAKQALARALVDQWIPQPDDTIGAPCVTQSGSGQPMVITDDSGAALVAAAHGPENLAILKQIGFGALLVVPLVVRGTLLGAITFVTPPGDDPFTPEEITLASDLAERCATALDNARLYREAETLRTVADEANRAKSAFLGNMSHELMTPLNVIGGYADVLEMGLHGPVTEQQRTDLTRIKQSQHHLVVLISDILTFVHSESGRIEYRFSSVPVQSALNEVVEMLDGVAKEKNLTLDRPGGEDGDAVAWADGDRVRQILMNLVMNAVKYADSSAGNITLSAAVAPDTVRIRVADAGPGIPSEKLQLIFDPFVQLAGALTKRQGGVGLGLAISRDLARAMNGDLTVESTVGIGSTFTLTLPRAREASPTS